MEETQRPYDVSINRALKASTVEKKKAKFLGRIKAIGARCSDSFCLDRMWMFRIHATDEQIRQIKALPEVWDVRRPAKPDFSKSRQGAPDA